jgi:hypothetical protein
MARRHPEVLERIRDATVLSAREFIDRHLFGTAPWAFRASPPEYDDFRAELAHRLGVDRGGITLVGSGRLGFSLNPQHLLTAFGADSDLDIVVASSAVFDATWLELLENAANISLASEDERRLLKKTKENFFLGYLRPDHLPLSTMLARDWFPKLASRFKSPVASRHKVKAWLFKSELHARVLYADHLARVQADIRRMISFSENK